METVKYACGGCGLEVRHRIRGLGFYPCRCEHEGPPVKRVRVWFVRRDDGAYFRASSVEADHGDKAAWGLPNQATLFRRYPFGMGDSYRWPEIEGGKKQHDFFDEIEEPAKYRTRTARAEDYWIPERDLTAPGGAKG